MKKFTNICSYCHIIHRDIVVYKSTYNKYIKLWLNKTSPFSQTYLAERAGFLSFYNYLIIFIFLRASRAAACSASFLLFPLPSPSTEPLWLTEAVNSLSWSGPDSPIIS